ncbi:hypothetical protein [Sphingomonas sp. CARO-RG-8B-R24-01]|uniref:helix-turn-helix domain-containing protein n=1 Tax=Sphingomonas sp. CARO-RG-8B-R24-01 TaxID=2914831 RepID=UPI001F5850EC|nr:hypothetical protein [Sphingomonas sp. CARO-RG-8B-R24-01]
MICHECGAHTIGLVKRGPLEVQLDPPRGSWRGINLGLSPREVSILHILTQRQRASHLSLLLVGVGEDVSHNSLKVGITHVCAKLPPEVRIESVRGWGYELIIKED